MKYRIGLNLNLWLSPSWRVWGNLSLLKKLKTMKTRLISWKIMKIRTENTKKVISALKSRRMKLFVSSIAYVNPCFKNASCAVLFGSKKNVKMSKLSIILPKNVQILDTYPNYHWIKRSNESRNPHNAITNPVLRESLVMRKKVLASSYPDWIFSASFMILLIGRIWSSFEISGRILRQNKFMLPETVCSMYSF